MNMELPMRFEQITLERRKMSCSVVFFYGCHRFLLFSFLPPNHKASNAHGGQTQTAEAVK